MTFNWRLNGLINLCFKMRNDIVPVSVVCHKMNTLNLYNRFNGISPLTEDSWVDLRSLLEPLEIKRNEYLIRKSSMVNHCYLLTEGVVRVFYNKEGTEYNKTFFTSGMFPTPLTALLSNESSALSFQALLLVHCLSLAAMRSS